MEMKICFHENFHKSHTKKILSPQKNKIKILLTVVGKSK